MDISTGELSQDDKALVRKWIADKTLFKQCAVCGEGQWVLADHVIKLVRFTEAAVVVGGVTYPVLPLICLNCGNTVLLNAVVVGVVSGIVTAKEANDAD